MVEIKWNCNVGDVGFGYKSTSKLLTTEREREIGHVDKGTIW